MVDVRLVKHSEAIDQLVDLFRLCSDNEMSAEIWDWKYLQNPFAPPDPDVIVALEGGRIVGARPFVFAEMWLGSEKVRAAHRSDTMVHPEHRNKGIFNLMGRFSIDWLKDNGYALSYGFPGPMARPGCLSQGYRIVAETEILFRPVNPGRLLSYGVRSRLLAKGLGAVCGRLMSTGAGKAGEHSSPFAVEVFDRFTDELRAVDGLRDESAISLVRSEDFLVWRFDRSPAHEHRYVTAKSEGELRGYAVVSVQRQPNGLVYGIVVDHLVKDRDTACFNALMNGCLTELDRSDYDITIVWAFSEPGLREEAMRNLGFRSSLRFPFRRFFSYAYLDAMRLDERAEGEVDVYDKRSWRVTHALSDMR